MSWDSSIRITSAGCSRRWPVVLRQISGHRINDGILPFSDIHRRISCKPQHIPDSDRGENVFHIQLHIGRIFQRIACIFLSTYRCPNSSIGRRHNILQRIPYPFGYILPSFSRLPLSYMKKRNNYTCLHRQDKRQYMIYNPDMLS